MANNDFLSVMVRDVELVYPKLGARGFILLFMAYVR